MVIIDMVYLEKIAKNSAYKAIIEITKKRKLILDGAMGTQIQKFKLKQRHYGKTARGNNDILNITQPKLIEKIHTDYLNAGADVLETNTFCSNSISQFDYNNPYDCEKLNTSAVLIAKRAGLKYSFYNKKRIFIAGSIGPTNKTSSIPIDSSKPDRRSISFDELVASYKTQINALINSRIDILLVETVFDTLNAKAAILSYLNAVIKHNIIYAIVISVTISDASGRTLSGQTLEAFWNSINHAKPLNVGLNCALGAEKIKQYALKFAKISNQLIWIYPNAGIPDEYGRYNEKTDDFACKMKKLSTVANALGGCCGSTPEHIIKIKSLKLKNIYRVNQFKNQNNLVLCGMDALKINRNTFYKVGERANVAGSLKFKKFILSENYEDALDLIRQQVINGAHIIDINMDDALINSEKELPKFIRLIGSEPDLARLPIMIDSSNWKTLLAGMKNTQGKCIINSISLKDGNEKFAKKAQTIRMYGCIPVTIAFDETGQATSLEHRLIIFKRAHSILTKLIGYSKEEIIFDLNTFAIATGIPEHDKNSIDLIRSIKLLSCLFPNANFISGVSNLSFSFRGNTKIRESLHSVFLKHAITAGLNIGIINVQNQLNYENLNTKVRDICKSLILNTKPISMEQILSAFNSLQSVYSLKSLKENNWRNWNDWSKLTYAVINGIEKYIENDSINLAKNISALKVIEGPLMEGMNIVGKLFGNGKMFLPQVVKSARVMKKAVASITPLIKTKKSIQKITILLATVKGDVHDIGKNIVGTVLSCNNYKIIDLGIMVPANDIIKAVIKYKANIIGLSGLISPSLEEMVQVARKLQKNKIKVPLLIGGATTSKLHTITKINPEYPNSIALHVSDASKAVDIVSKLIKYPYYIEMFKNEYKLLLQIYERLKSKENKISFENAKNRSIKYKLHIKNSINFIGKKLSITSNIKEDNHSNDFKNIMDVKNKIIERKILQTMKLEKWISIKRNVCIFKTKIVNDKIILLNSKGRLLGSLIMLRQQINSERCLSLNDFIGKDLNHLSAYTCTLGIEATIIQRYFKNKGRLQCAAVFKSICDNLLENCSKNTYNIIRFYLLEYISKRSQNYNEGERGGIRPGPGYPICPDHNMKYVLNRILKSKENIGLITTKNRSLIPQNSIIALMIPEISSVYFNIGSIGIDQVKSYAKMAKINVKLVESLLSSVINYIPKFML
ncbi:methionine synthase [Candidatus Hodgkinia cicadicola]